MFFLCYLRVYSNKIMNLIQEEEEARKAEELARQQALAEHRRMEQEREERERKRQENEIQQIKDRHLKEKMQQISQTSHGQKVLKKLDENVRDQTYYLLEIVFYL